MRHKLPLWMICACAAAWAQEPNPLPIEESLAIRTLAIMTRVVISPDGSKAAYTVNGASRSAEAIGNREQWTTREGVPPFLSDAEIRVVDVASGKTIHRLQGTGTHWAPSWSPDGKEVAYFSTRGGSVQVWTLNVASGAARRISPAVIRTNEGFERAIWTGNGQELLVKVARENSVPAKTEAPPAIRVYRSAARTAGDASTSEASKYIDPAWSEQYAGDLAMVGVRDGSVRRIARGYQPVGVWISPDERYVAFTSARGWENGYSDRPVFDVVVMAMNGGGEPLVVPAIRQIKGMSVSWSSDSGSVAYTNAAGDCFILPLKGTPRTIVRPPRVSLAEVWRGPLWDVPGKNLYFVAQGAVWKAPLDTGTAAQAAAISGKPIAEIVAPAMGGGFYSPDGKSMHVFARDPRTRDTGLYRVDLSTGAAALVAEQKRTLVAPATLTLDSAAQGFIYAAHDPRSGVNLWAAAGGGVRQVGEINPQLAKYSMGENRLVSWRSTDGRELSGALLLPAGYREGRRYPLIVHVYGADSGSEYVNLMGLSGHGTTNLQLLASRGYAVLYPDTPWGVGSPVKDLLSSVIPAIDKLIEMGIAAPDRIGVMGGSKGGYSTVALITHSRRFRAAIMSAGYGNLMSAYGQMEDSGAATTIAIMERNGMGGSPWEQPQRYIENSPVFALDKVQTPLLILHGGADQRVSPFLADEIFVDLRRLGKEVEYAKYMHEGHTLPNWTYPDLVDYWTRTIDWFDKKLKP